MTERLSTGRPASSLDAAKNDTGRVAFCGPYVLSAITGYGISKIEDVIREGRDLPPNRKPVVRGTYADEVEAALAYFGYRMELKESHLQPGAQGTADVLDMDAEAEERLGLLHPRDS